MIVVILVSLDPGNETPRAGDGFFQQRVFECGISEILDRVQFL
jgi:hypothetical protein